MSDLQEAGATPGDGSSGEEWLSIEETAARLQVSARTIKRRLAASEWPARYDALPGGGRRRLLLFASRVPSERDARAIGENAKSDSARDAEATLSNVKSPQSGVSDNARDTTARDTGDAKDARDNDTQAPKVAALENERDAALAEIERLKAERDREREEVLFLRERVAELNAVVMQTARALPSQASSRAIERPAIDTIGTTSATAQEARPTPAKAPRKPRPFWAVILGIRPK